MDVPNQTKPSSQSYDKNYYLPDISYHFVGIWLVLSGHNCEQKRFDDGLYLKDHVI